MKIPHKKFDDICEQDVELTRNQILELKRRIKGLENLVRYVIYSEIIPKGRWRLFLNSSAAGFKYGKSRVFQILFANESNIAFPMTRAHVYRE